MKCNVYVSFSLFILIDTLYYTVSASHFVLSIFFFVYKDVEMYAMLELMKFDTYNVVM